ncbi:MAG: hypothetical protein HYZ63_02610 [Candidatus Andersenbacteria bacterium]|nr:hypothetical protein [Candidatus Andersenbacteria bacterium]
MNTLIDANAAKLAGLQIDTLQKVRSGHITLDHWEGFNLLTKEERDKLFGNGTAPVVKEKPKPQSILRLISGEERLMLDPTDGKETIPNAKAVFPAHIDSDFRNWEADETSEPTGETRVAVYEMVQDAKFEAMFTSLSAEKETLCLTHSQIIGFVKKYRNWLRTDGYATFFLFRSHGKFFVAYVCFDDCGPLEVGVFRFEYDRVWSGDYRHRVVVPQL